VTKDEIYLQRCLELAKNGMGHVAPNPMVGCVVVHNDRIVGEGYHQQYGERHAEVNAINAVADHSILPESTLYVNLEPCAHFGKTPPCANLVAEHQLKRVVIGCVDPHDEVAGKGIEKLKTAGCEVEVGVLEKESLELNKRFFTFHQQQRPYVILKWAQTLDGFIDKHREPNETGINWITNKFSKILVHKWRTEEQAILVGTNTALTDNPSLTAREYSGNSPLRLVIDRTLKLSDDSNLLDGSVATVVYNEVKNEVGKYECAQLDFSSDILPQIMQDLHQRNVQSVIVEGGQHLLSSFIEKGSWDEARILIGETTFGKGLKAPIIEQQHISKDNIKGDQLLIYRNNK
jgi:diaminohydroxyphosphoribosylaminopyrimidine deaminase/5-amino-6-(5-phosphoribosylamino)uracil reductase